MDAWCQRYFCRVFPNLLMLSRPMNEARNQSPHYNQSTTGQILKYWFHLPEETGCSELQFQQGWCRLLHDCRTARPIRSLARTVNWKAETLWIWRSWILSDQVVLKPPNDMRMIEFIVNWLSMDRAIGIDCGGVPIVMLKPIRTYATSCDTLSSDFRAMIMILYQSYPHCSSS